MTHLKMGTKIYMSFFILFTIFCEGIALSEENTNESSGRLVRKKRLIDLSPEGNKRVPIQQVPYIVNIQEDGIHICAGTILEHHVIITAAHCFEDDKISRYRVLSGSANVKQGVRHNVTKILIHPQYHPTAYKSDIALLIIFPYIDLIHSPNRRIPLHIGNVPPNILGTISGWGCNSVLGHYNGCTSFVSGLFGLWNCMNPIVFDGELRSIAVPVMSLDRCRHMYLEDPEITNKIICTFDPSAEKKCSSGDSGNPLVVHGRLAGLMAWNAKQKNNLHLPDVFVNLFHPIHRNWILSIIPHT